MSASGICEVCGVPSTLMCKACKQVYYCGKEHQKIAWNSGHKSECKCFKVVRNDTLGRYLCAKRDIKVGEIILVEAPLIYGPKTASSPICLGCHRKLDTPETNYYKCSSCAWPMCGPECEKSPHHTEECKLMTSRKYTAKIDYKPSNEQTGKKESSYCVILPLRCMLLKKNNPELYEKFAALEDHLQERLDTPLYRVLRANLLTFIRTILGMSDWSEEEILRVAARLDTNAFEVRHAMGYRSVRGIYPTAAMLSHDCVSNTRHVFDEQMNIVVISKKPIAKGEIICTTYTQTLKSTLMRREHLAQAKCFDCTCNRCKDPTELDTFAGAIMCSKCLVGKIVSTNPLDNSAVWRCRLCPHELPAKQIKLGNSDLLKEIDSLDKTSVKAYEDFLHRYRALLHDTNTHVLQVKYALIQLYGRAPGFSIQEMNDAALRRKIELCQELLEVADKLDGGWSTFRGNLLLDLQETMFIKTKREYLNGLHTQAATKEKFTECLEILKEAIEIMHLEPDMTQPLTERTQLLTRELQMDLGNDVAQDSE